MTLISVIMSVHNMHQSVSEAIQSVQQQDFHDWEFTVVDDASTDETGNVLEDMAATDSRIKIRLYADSRGKL